MSYAILAGMFGALASGTLAERLGRKPTIMISDLFLMAGSVVLSISLGSIMLALGRLIVGVGFGISLMVGPIFISESAPLSLR